MDGLKEAIESIVNASSGHSKTQAMHKVSKHFYFLCRKMGMKKEDILSLATEIIGVFTEDMKVLQSKTTEKKNEKR